MDAKQGEATEELLLISGRGVIDLILLGDKSETRDGGAKLSFARRRMAERLLFRGLNLADFLAETGAAKVKPFSKPGKLNQLKAFLEELHRSPDLAKRFTKWIYARGYWNDAQSLELIQEVAMCGREGQ